MRKEFHLTNGYYFECTPYGETFADLSCGEVLAWHHCSDNPMRLTREQIRSRYSACCPNCKEPVPKWKEMNRWTEYTRKGEIPGLSFNDIHKIIVETDCTGVHVHVYRSAYRLFEGSGSFIKLPDEYSLYSINVMSGHSYGFFPRNPLGSSLKKQKYRRRNISFSPGWGITICWNDNELKLPDDLLRLIDDEIQKRIRLFHYAQAPDMSSVSEDITRDSFIATSDFHVNQWPLDKVTDYYIHEYETVYILGDATDRGPHGDGTGGLEILCKIKDLTERSEGRVVYIPGNHDFFLYLYGGQDNLSVKLEARANLQDRRNGGKQTVHDFDKMAKSDSSKAQALMSWLGSLPIQRTCVFDGQKYALAHAFFNQRLYNEVPDFCLKDLIGYDNEMSNCGNDVLWFRKGDVYDRSDVPSCCIEIIIGHTPLIAREGESLDLKNATGETVKVHCVDGGITFPEYDGAMLKFVSGGNMASSAVDVHNFIEPLPRVFKT